LALLPSRTKSILPGKPIALVSFTHSRDRNQISDQPFRTTRRAFPLRRDLQER
jgi:hypothetical protein